SVRPDEAVLKETIHGLAKRYDVAERSETGDGHKRPPFTAQRRFGVGDFAACGLSARRSPRSSAELRPQHPAARARRRSLPESPRRREAEAGALPLRGSRRASG